MVFPICFYRPIAASRAAAPLQRRAAAPPCRCAAALPRRRAATLRACVAFKVLLIVSPLRAVIRWIVLHGMPSFAIILTRRCSVSFTCVKTLPIVSKAK